MEILGTDYVACRCMLCDKFTWDNGKEKKSGDSILGVVCKECRKSFID